MTEDTSQNNLDLLTVAEVCEILGVSKYNVYRLIHSGGLPAVRLRTARNKYRVRRSDVEKYVAGEFETVELANHDVYRSVAEVATRLNCSHETVRRLVNAGSLDAIRFPGRSSRLRICDAAVDAYVERNRATPTADEKTA